MTIKLAHALSLCMFASGCGAGVAESVEALSAADGGVGVGDAPALDPRTDPAMATPIEGSGVITLAGGAQSGLADGMGTSARFNNPANLALGPDGNVYVADHDNGEIRLVRPSGMTLTFTRQAGFSHPFGLAFAPDGTLYAQTDSDDRGDRSIHGGMIWRLDRRTGAATPVARNAGRPRGLLALPDGRLVMVDNEHHVVRLLDPRTGAMTDLAGVTDAPGFADGTGAAARFDQPSDVVLTSDNRLIVADRSNHRLRVVTLDGVVSTYVGTGAPGSIDGHWSTASFNLPQGLGVDAEGNVFVTEMGGFNVRRVSIDGMVTTVAGVGAPGYADGEAPQAMFFGMEGLDVSADGQTLYVADGNRGGTEASHRIRRIELVDDKL